MSCIPSLGALSPLHVMVVPSRHFKSFAAITDDSLRADVLHIKMALEQYNADRFVVNTAYFEHGTGTNPNSTCACVEHAHLHAIGCNIDLSETLIRQFGFVPFDRFDIISQSDLAQSGYYFYQYGSGRKLITTRPLEQQFFRILYWRAIGHWDSWNWRLNYNLSRVHEVISNYSGIKDYVSRGGPGWVALDAAVQRS